MPLRPVPHACGTVKQWSGRRFPARAGLRQHRRGPVAPHRRSSPGRYPRLWQDSSHSPNSFVLRSAPSRFAFPVAVPWHLPSDPRPSCALFPLTPSGDSPSRSALFHASAFDGIRRAGCAHVRATQTQEILALRMPRGVRNKRRCGYARLETGRTGHRSNRWVRSAAQAVDGRGSCGGAAGRAAGADLGRRGLRAERSRPRYCGADSWTARAVR